ncbi:MAG: hypothetical protein JNG84_00530 [Archangium sp.]|nr:hypothetical protein [Archangium sp.]
MASVRSLFSVVAVLLAAAAQAEVTELGAVLPDSARKVAERRYKAAGDFEAVMKFYKTTYPAAQYPRKAVIHQPGVKAIHIPNTSGRGGWEGLNIYETNDEVRIYVVPGAAGGKKK